MKKLVVLLAAAAAASCSTPQEKPRYIIETPFGQEDVYDETITPEVYAIVATRVTNKMLDQTTAIYEKIPAPTLYVMEVKKEDESLPNGFYHARRVSKDIIKGSRTFTIVENMNDADYYIETIVSAIPLEGIEVPAVKYTLTLYDKDNKQINQWSEAIQQIQNDDKSWW